MASLHSYNSLPFTAGSKKSAGLPNITGETQWMSGGLNDYRVKGAFGETIDTHLGLCWSTHKTGYKKEDFDASRCSSIYGKSSTVQPNSLTSRFYIKF